jgi:uncharacterized membrane protein YfcA
VTGIGGGVYLTPLLILLGWTATKTAAGVSALFIVVNSIAGLAGLGDRAWVWQPVMASAVVVGLACALAGAHWSVAHGTATSLRRLLAVVLAIAGARCFLNAAL